MTEKTDLEKRVEQLEQKVAMFGWKIAELETEVFENV